jgi:NADPH oxidase
VLYHPGNVMELRFSKPSFKYKAGMWLFLNVPEVSGWQWHPVSAVRGDDEDEENTEARRHEVAVIGRV